MHTNMLEISKATPFHYPSLAQTHVQVPLTRRVGELAVAADGDAVGVSHPATPDGASLAVLIAPNLQWVLVGKG